MSNPVISVIIPTYNRFEYLIQAIKSVKQQKYENIEIIVVNDHSTDEKYYEYNWKNENIIFKTTKYRSKEIYGFPCAAYVRNEGVEISNGSFIAFLDDDDLWLENKTDDHIIPFIEESKCSKNSLSSSDGYWGNKPNRYLPTEKYVRYNEEKYSHYILSKYKMESWPNILTKNEIAIHNSIVTSSVIVHSKLFKKIGFPILPNGQEDYQCWLNCLQHTNLRYYNMPTFYYDDAHGYGRNY